EDEIESEDVDVEVRTNENGVQDGSVNDNVVMDLDMDIEEDEDGRDMAVLWNHGLGSQISNGDEDEDVDVHDNSRDEEVGGEVESIGMVVDDIGVSEKCPEPPYDMALTAKAKSKSKSITNAM